MRDYSAIDELFAAIGMMPDDYGPDDYERLALKLAEGGVPSSVTDAVLDALSGARYSATDLAQDIATLQAQLPRETVDAAPRASVVLTDLLRAGIEATSGASDTIWLTTQVGMGLIGPGGRLRTGNPGLCLLLGTPLSDAPPVDAWFADVRGLADGFARDGTVHTRSRVRLLTGDAAERYVDVEIGPADRERGDSYIVLVEVTAQVLGERTMFDHAAFGIVRVDRNDTITYCNPHLALSLGAAREDFEGQKFVPFLADVASRARASEELRNREAGKATHFEVAIDPGGGAPRRISLLAIPEFADDGHTRIGTLALVRLVEPERLYDEVKAGIEQLDDPQDMVELIHAKTKGLIAHDNLVLTLSTGEEQEWTWPAYSAPPPDPPYATRWFELSAEVRSRIPNHLTRHGHVIIEDFPAWIADLPEDDPLRRDKTVETTLALDTTRSTLSVPIADPDAPFYSGASIVLVRRGGASFSEGDSALLAQMKLGELLAAVKLQIGRRRQKLRDELYNKASAELARGNRWRTEGLTALEERQADFSRHVAAARVICEHLARNHSWESTELYKVDRGGRTLVCLAHYRYDIAARAGAFVDDRHGHLVALDKGLAGAAYRTKQAQVVDAAHTAPTFDATNDWAISAISIPICLEREVVFVLHLEDRTAAAFNAQECEDLEEFARCIEEMLKRLYDQALLEEIFTHASDAIFLVDDEGTIRFANAAAARFTGRERPSALANVLLGDLLVDRQAVEAIFETTHLANYRASIRHRDGATRYVLLSASDLPDAFGLKVVYAADVQLQTLQADLKMLQSVLAGVAGRAQMPLARLRGLSHRLARRVTDDEERAAVLEQADRFFSEVKLTYERVAAHVDWRRARFDGLSMEELGAFVRRAAAAVPDSGDLDEWLAINTPEPLFADVYPQELGFAVRSILDYLRRRKADEARVAVALEGRSREATLTLAAETPAPPDRCADPFRYPYELGDRMVQLGENAIRFCVEVQHDGTYHYKHDGVRESFAITLAQSAFEADAVGKKRAAR